jgi:hypothetical protein
VCIWFNPEWFSGPDGNSGTRTVSSSDDHDERDDPPVKTISRPSDVITATVQRPAQTVTHPSGARIQVPGGPVLFSPKVRLKEVPVPAALARCQRLAPVLRFDSYAGQVIDGKTVVDLPAGKAGQEATVLVWSRLGFWLPLPSQPISLTGGGTGRRVLIDREPTPWIFTVVAQGQAPVTGKPKNRLARWEQLNWTDKAALERDIAGSTQRSRGWSFFPSAYADGEKFSDPVLGPLEAAIERFYRARAAGRFGQKGAAWARYLEGLRYLKMVRTRSYAKEEIDLTTEGIRWPGGLPTSSRVPVVLEILCSNFAPWGLDLTLRLAESDDGVLQQGFDLNVLPCVGELPWADVSLALRSASTKVRGPWDAALDQIVKEKNLTAADARRTVVLRFYSPRVLEAGYIETALEFTKDTVLRWGPSVLALCSTNPASAVVPLAFAATDLAWEWLQKEFPPSPTEYATVELTQLGAGAGADAVAVIEDGALKFFGKEIKVGKINGPALLLDTAVTLALIYYKWDPGQIRELATGPLGYKQSEDGVIFSSAQFNVPPIMVIGWVEGPYKRSATRDPYPVAGKFNRAWLLNYSVIYQETVFRDGLHGGIERGFGSELTGIPFQNTRKGVPWTEILKALDKDFFPPVDELHFRPEEQSFAFQLRKDVLSMIATERKLRDPWDKVNIDDLKLDVVLEMRGNDPKTLRLPLQEAPASYRTKKEHRRFAVRLAQEDHEPSVPDSCPVATGVPVAGKLPELLAKYKLKVVDRQGTREWFTAEVDFHSDKAKRSKLERVAQDWWGDNVEQVSWHTMEVAPMNTPTYVIGSVYMKIPFRYRITGSVVYGSAPQDGTPFRMSNAEEKPLSWQGRSVSLISTANGGQNGMVTETGKLMLDESGTKVASFDFIQSSQNFGESVRFTLRDIPLRYTGRIGKSGAEFVIFAFKDDELRKGIASFKSKTTRTVTETDPKTQKPVQSTVTSEMTELGVTPKEGGPCFLAIMMANKTEQEMEALAKSGQLTEADMQKEMTKMQSVLKEWVGR